MNKMRVAQAKAVRALSQKYSEKTVSITLLRNFVQQARKRKLNISRITEQALTSTIAYLEGYIDGPRESQH